MKQRLFSGLCAGLLALLLCLSLCLPALAYPAGADTSLPRVADNAGLFTAEEITALEERIYELIAAYETDIVILTEDSIGGQVPYVYADDYFDYGGYGWRSEETEDITTGSGVILLLVNMHADFGRDIEISSKGTAMSVFGPDAVDRMLDDMIPLLTDKDFLQAAELFLDRAAGHLNNYAQGYEGSTYAEGYTYSYYDNQNDYRTRDQTILIASQIFLVGLIIAFILALVIVLSMKRKMNTARPQTHASEYMIPGSFRLTQQNDTFLYSKTTKVRIDTDSHSSGGGGGFSSGGGARISSSGSSHSGGGRRF